MCASTNVNARAAMSELETQLNTYRAIQKEIGKVQNQISTAQTQILENEMVLKVRPLFGGTRLNVGPCMWSGR